MGPEPPDAAPGAPVGGARPAGPVHLLGVDVDPLTREQAAAAVVCLAGRRQASLVVTPNVDHVVLLRKDTAFQRAYGAAALRLCDGAPLAALAKLCGQRPLHRVTGADLMVDVCALAARDRLRVFVAGGAPDVLERGLTALRTRYPGLLISGHSPPTGFEGSPADLELQLRIAEAEPQIIMVCIGSPRSEKWAAGQLEGHPAVYLCVGAAIDFAAGARPRAPEWMQRLGLEWAYRLRQEPTRMWRRYLQRDLVFFPLAARAIWRARRRA